MPNELFRNRLTAKIEASLAEYRAASGISHSLLTGRIREIAIENLLEPLLPIGFHVGTGKITDSAGRLSSETDMVVYTSRLMPPLMYGKSLGVFPIDSCMAAIEAKSTLTAAGLKSTIAACRQLTQLTYSSGQYDGLGTGASHTVKAVVRAALAFETDLTSESDFERYKKQDDGWNTKPALDGLCVVGRGAWLFVPSQARWSFAPPSVDHDEVICFLIAIVNALLDVAVSRGHPRPGPYFFSTDYLKDP